jgi:hypothetical protein
MSQEGKFELLIDIARLIKKYGPDTFEELANYLRKKETFNSLIELLKTSSKAAKVVSSPTLIIQAEKKKVGIKGFLSRMEKTEPIKAHILSAFHDELLAKAVLPNLREIKDFASDSGLRLITAGSRDKAIFPLLKDLGTRQIDEIKTIINNANRMAQRSDRTLEAWTGIILDRERDLK